MNTLTTIDLADLDNVTGGAALDLSYNGRFGQGQANFSSGARPDPNAQLRCYQQVASQAGWLQAPRETLRQQRELCGTFQAPSASPQQ
ncbi:MAG TPA: hypothetical protein VIV11_25880 [Kofleriaceae bacterium]